MRNLATKLGLGLALWLCSPVSEAAPSPFVLESARNFPASVENLHFFQATTSKGLLPDRPLGPETATDCRAHIREILCLVEPSETEERRSCLEGGEVYAPVFETLYDQYPPVLQRVFCSLDVLYVEKSFFGTAYAGTLPDGATIMGIRQSVLDEGLRLQRWSSWKEQLSFGGTRESYTVDPQLPTTATATSANVNDFLYFVIAHEFGHVLDFSNKLNDVTDCGDAGHGDQECAMKPGSWGSISWLTNRTPRPENDFPNRKGLCFYMCEEGTLDRSVIGQVYEDLFTKTDFISTYATQQPWDDFADSLAYYIIDQKLGSTYLLETNQGRAYDVIARLGSEAFRHKHEYLERFVNRTDIVYP